MKADSYASYQAAGAIPQEQGDGDDPSYIYQDVPQQGCGFCGLIFYADDVPLLAAHEVVCEASGSDELDEAWQERNYAAAAKWCDEQARRDDYDVCGRCGMRFYGDDKQYLASHVCTL